MTRDEAIEIARTSRSLQHPASATGSAGEPFEPAEWVIDAIRFAGNTAENAAPAVSKIDHAFAAAEWQFIASSFGLARAALKQAGYPDQQFEGAQVLAATKADEFRRMGGAS